MVTGHALERATRRRLGRALLLHLARVEHAEIAALPARAAVAPLLAVLGKDRLGAALSN